MKKPFLLSSFLLCLTRFKINYIIGSYAAHFSTLAFLGPIIGTITQLPTLMLSFGGFFLWMLLHTKTILSIKLLYHIPSYIGMAYSCLNFSQSSYPEIKQVFAAIIPALCIGIFLCNPIGMQAWPYALLWVFPCVFPWLKRPSFFWQALASTLTTHAVGSVLWLYAHHLTAQEWLALTPITILERISISVISTALFYLGRYLVRLDWNKISLWIKLKKNYYSCHHFN